MCKQFQTRTRVKHEDERNGERSKNRCSPHIPVDLHAGWWGEELHVLLSTEEEKEKENVEGVFAVALVRRLPLSQEMETASPPIFRIFRLLNRDFALTFLMLLVILLLAVLLLLAMLLYSESLRQKQNEREQVFLSFPPKPYLMGALFDTPVCSDLFSLQSFKHLRHCSPGGILPIYTDNRFFGKNKCVSPDTWNKCITGSTNSDAPTKAREEKKEGDEKKQGAAGGHGGLQETGEEHAVFAGETGEEGGRAGGAFWTSRLAKWREKVSEHAEQLPALLLATLYRLAPLRVPLLRVSMKDPYLCWDAIFTSSGRGGGGGGDSGAVAESIGCKGLLRHFHQWLLLADVSALASFTNHITMRTRMP
jgi:hypothetical protein